jgi:hypothetical protein
MKKHLLILMLPVVFACSCKTTKKTAADNGANNIEVINSESFRKPLKDAELYGSTTDLVPLDTVFISKDTLNIFTKKILGCDADNFKLIWNGELGKAMPPQTAVKLFQLVDGACKERHKFHLAYNISPLKLKSDTSTNKSTIIKVGGWGKMNTYVHN